MYSYSPHNVQGGAGQPGHHASLPAFNPNMNTPAAGGAVGLAPTNPGHHQPPQHHMMYNPHQYAHQSPYGGAGNPIMTGMPQMHNGGMAHGNSNGGMWYKQPLFPFAKNAAAACSCSCFSLSLTFDPFPKSLFPSSS